MEEQGPAIQALTRRLAECPADFLAEPRIGAAGTVHVAAVVSDLVRDLGGSLLTPDQAAAFVSQDARRDRNRLQLVLIACWLLYDPGFRGRQSLADPARFFLGKLGDLAEMVQAPRFVSEPDRREELARLCLRHLGLRPDGESPEQAQDRLATLSTAERRRVIEEARRAEERARQIREAMARKAAKAASMKAMRE